MKKAKYSLSTWIISYLAVLFLPVLFSVIITTTSFQKTKQNTQALAMLALKQTANGIENIISGVVGSGREILASKEVSSILYAKQPLSPAKNLRIYALQDAMQQKAAYSPYITDIYVHFTASGTTASTKGILREDGFSAELNKFGWPTLEQFISDFRHTNAAYSVHIVHNQHNTETPAKQAAIILRLLSAGQTGDAFCVILLNTNAFNSLLQSYVAGTPNIGAKLWILDTESRYISSTGTEDIPPEVQYSMNAWENGTTLRYQTKPYVFTRQQASNNTLLLVSAIPAGNYLADVNQLKLIFILYYVICLAGGGCAAVYFARKNYTPVRKLTHYLVTQLNDTPAKNLHTNEFAALEDGVRTLVQHYNTSSKTIRKQKQILHNLNLSHILQGKIHADDNFTAFCTEAGFSFATDWFMVIGIQVRDYSSWPLENNISESDEAAQLLNTVITSIIVEMLHEDFGGYIAELDDSFYYIACLQQAPANPENLDVLHALAGETCKKAFAYLRERLGISSVYFLSEWQQGFEHIPAQYICTREGLETVENFQLKSPVLYSKDIAALFPYTAQVTPLSNRELEFTEMVTSCEYDKAMLIYTEILSDMVNVFGETTAICRMITFYLVIRIADDHSLLHKNSMREVFKTFAENLQASKTVQTMAKHVEVCLRQLFPAQAEETEHSPSGIGIDEIIFWIDTHYHNPDISVANIAEYFGISQSYLLRIMKKSYYSGVLDYIHKKRIDAAKTLLTNTSITIAEVARKVGYYNSLALIRAFKRTQGVTPAAYRDGLES